MCSAVPAEITVDVSQDLHEVWMNRGEANAGGLPHVNSALLCQVHVVEVDELKLGLLLRPEWTQKGGNYTKASVKQQKGCISLLVLHYLHDLLNNASENKHGSSLFTFRCPNSGMLWT